MNKIIVPTVLAATVLIGAVFAFYPVEKASSFHLSTGLPFRVASGSTALVGADAGNEVFTITCPAGASCFVDSIEVWTTAGDEDADVIHIVNVNGQVPILTADLAVPANNGPGDIAVGAANPGFVVNAIQYVRDLAPNSQTALLPEVLTATNLGTIGVSLDNPTDDDGDRSVQVVFVGRIIGGVAPTVVAFTNN
jgi:hypothetical protein